MFYYLLKYPIIVLPTLLLVLPIAILFHRMAYLHKSMRFLFLYLCFKLVIDLLMWHMASRAYHNLYLENLEMVIRASFLYKMYHSEFKSGWTRKSANWLFVAYLLVVVRDISTHGMQVSLPFIGLAEAIIIIGLSLIYFVEIAERVEIGYLWRHTFFYINCGLLLFFSQMLVLAPFSPNWDVHPYNYAMQIFMVLPHILESLLILIISFGFYVNK